MTEKVVWHVVKMHAKKLEMPKLAPHDLRRSCARFCHAAGGELEQIQFLLGHVSVQTRSGIWAANSDFVKPWTIGSASNPCCETERAGSRPARFSYRNADFRPLMRNL